MKHKEADMNYIAEHLREEKRQGNSVGVLIGAGMSVSAGIPTAKGIIEEIKKRYPQLSRSEVHEETYQAYMNALTPVQRRELIGLFVDQAKINIAHLYLASMVKEHYVDRILTTNFDPLVIRSLALSHLYPAVYDLAASPAFIPGESGDVSVYYLHGQRDGFVLLNTSEEVNQHFKRLTPVFKDVIHNRCWIVIGYSGVNDPVFKQLCRTRVFQHKLFWVSRSAQEPPQHVLDHILSPQKKYGYYVKGFDADTFFFTLTRTLQLPEPQIISKPFTHLKEALDSIADYCMNEHSVDLTRETKKWIELAIQGFEEGKGFEHIKEARQKAISVDELTRRARELWVHDRFDQIDSLLPMVQLHGSPSAKKHLAMALKNWGISLKESAENKSEEESTRLIMQAIEKYKIALKLKTDNYEIYNSWGIALFELAKKKQGQPAKLLLRQASDKFKAALLIKPEDRYVLNNLGTTFTLLAQYEKPVQAEQLLRDAGELFEESVRVKPDFFLAWDNWGKSLIELALIKKESGFDELIRQAEEKLMRAESLSPGSGSYNLACLYAIKNQPDIAFRWLEAALIFQPGLSKSTILEDSQLQNLKTLSRMKTLLDSHRPGTR